MPLREVTAIRTAIGAAILTITCLCSPGDSARGADQVDATFRPARSGAADSAAATTLRVRWAIESTDAIIESASETRPAVSSAAATMPVAAIVPKASPVPRKYQPFPGFQSPAAAPSRASDADTPANEAQPATMTASRGPARGPVPPLSNYSLPPGRYAGAEILRLAHDLESTRIATRPGREIGLR